MAKVTLLVCDECGTHETVKHYELREGSRRATIDLCGPHSEWMDKVLGAAPKARRKPRGRPNKVTTMEEIEKLKGAENQNGKV